MVTFSEDCKNLPNAKVTGHLWWLSPIGWIAGSCNLSVAISPLPPLFLQHHCTPAPTGSTRMRKLISYSWASCSLLHSCPALCKSSIRNT